MYICVFCRSVGAGSATTRNTRGLTRSVIALIVPPLPAPSRPSKTTQTLRPLCTTHCWSLTSSTWRRRSSSSYALRFSFSGSADFFAASRAAAVFFAIAWPSRVLFVLERLLGDLRIERDQLRDELFVLGMLGDDAAHAVRVLEHAVQEVDVAVLEPAARVDPLLELERARQPLLVEPLEQRLDRAGIRLRGAHGRSPRDVANDLSQPFSGRHPYIYGSRYLRIASRASKDRDSARGFGQLAQLDSGVLAQPVFDQPERHRE